MNSVNKDSENSYSENSDEISVIPGKTYQVSTKFVGLEGIPYSGYFGIVMLNENRIEKERKIRWMNDFSGDEKTIQIIFKPTTNKIIMLYRMNKETPIHSKCKFNLLPLDKISILEENSPESFDNIQDYVVPYQKQLSKEEELLLETQMVWIFGTIRSGTTWLGGQLLNHHSLIYWHEPYIGDHLKTINDWPLNPHYFFAKNHKPNWLPILRKLLLARTFSQTNTLSMKIIVKEPNGSGGANILLECLPKSQLIFLLRDGRDVVDQ